MKVLSGPLGDFGDFELNVKDIAMYTDDEQNIMLPYRGKLPLRMGHALDAHIYINVQLVQEVKIVLVVNRDCMKPIRRPVSASVSEVKELLDRFFSDAENGLSPYWCGVWQSDYIAWRMVMDDPSRLSAAIVSMTPEQRAKLRSILDQLC